MRHWAVLVAMVVQVSAVHSEVLLSEAEISQTLSFGPWPPSLETDPSNRVSGDSRAIALGAALFRDPILSVDGAFSCASCHLPENAFTIPQARALGRTKLDRNSPSLRNLAGLRWYGWGGKSDNLWAASLHPILDELEMANTAENWKDVLQGSLYSRDYEALFGPLAAQPPEQVLVNTGKLLAAYQETLVTAPTAFDAFRDALERGDLVAAASYPETAQQGLQLFLGEGNCVFCHSGPRFSNNEFHDAGVPYFLSETEVDPGRFAGLQTLLSSPYTLNGIWSDDPQKGGAWAVQSVRQSHADFGTFRTPSLRGVAETMPYMHDGSLKDLNAVIRHYNEIDLERMHADGEAVLSPLELSERQIASLVAFLKTLSEIRE
ncbi:cytochrome-c peroxidase [Pseudophaeobacter sp.]|uniref:cytochrome-c peroxidase n=1 Tax=Pseudophaeobacter sp. TaxID=1971739 RepID=UPI004059102C